MTPEQQAEIDAQFERLFASFQRPIFGYLCRLLGDAARAEEVAQDVFVKAYRAYARLPEDANERAWLYRIATNSAYDVLRRKRLIQWLPLLDRDRSYADETDPADSIGERDAVQQALDQLPPHYRAPLVLYSVEEYSVKEVSEIMGISEGAVKTRLYRAREQFRRVYGGDI